MSQILIRQPMGNGNNQLVPAHELSRDGNMVRVKVDGQFHVKEIPDTMIVANSDVCGDTVRDRRKTGRPIIRLQMDPNCLASYLQGK